MVENVAIVSGGAGGIGGQVSKRLASLGYLLATSRNLRQRNTSLMLQGNTAT